MARTVKVGLVAPFSGRGYVLGYDALFGARLAIREWNSRGGVGGYLVELIAYDDRNERNEGLLQARKLVIDPNVMGVIGHLANLSALVAAEEYHRAGLAMISTGATAEELTMKGYPGVLRLSPRSSILWDEVTRFAAESLQSSKVAIIAPDELGDEQKEMSGAVRKNGLSIVAEETLTKEQRDYENIVQRLRAARPDLVLFSGYPAQGATLLAQLRQAGIEATFFGGPFLDNPDFVSIGGPWVKGTYYVSIMPSLAPTPTASAFARAYSQLWNTEPSGQAALAYEATNLLLEAIQRAIRENGKPHRPAVIGALANQRTREGVTGPISFDSKGDIREPRVSLYRIVELNYPGQLEKIVMGR